MYINNYLSMHVYSGARASRTLVNQGGYFGVGGGANVVSTTVGMAGQVTVWGGGYAADNVIETWGAMILSSGARADRTDIHASGGLHIYAGAQADAVTIRDGATLGIGGGGKVNGVTEEHGAGMVFYEGSLVSGRIQMGGTVTVNGILDGSGALFVFDLSSRTFGDGIILNSMGAVSGANYQISLSGLEASGQYALAGGASGFTGSMTVSVGSVTAGSVTVGGPSLLYGDLSCSLLRSGDTLLFDLARIESLSGRLLEPEDPFCGIPVSLEPADSGISGLDDPLNFGDAADCSLCDTDLLKFGPAGNTLNAMLA